VTNQGESVEVIIDDCGVYESGGRRPGHVALEDAAQVAAETDGFVWIGLHEPTAEQFAVVARTFDLPAFAVDDAVLAHQRPKVEVYDGMVFAVLKPATYVDSEEVVEVSEIAVFHGPHFVVTVRHGDSEVLAHVRADLADGADELLALGPTAVLYRLADRIVDQYEDVAEAITVDVEDIEGQVFGDGAGDSDGDHAKRIYFLKTELIEFRRAMSPLALPLSRLADGHVDGVAPESAHYFRDVHDHLMRATDVVDSHDRMLTDVLSADLAQVSVRQNRAAARLNDDVRKISAWAAIAAIPTAIAGIYGMNFDNMPELRWEYGYFLVVAVIVAACVGLGYAFRRNGWL